MVIRMNGFAAHAFAAVMTFTVLTFPTPSDLRSMFNETFQSEKVNEIRNFPTVEPYEPPVNSFVPASNFFPVVDACIVEARHFGIGENPDCQIALNRLAEATGATPAVQRIATDEATLQVATAFYCRAEWTEAQRFGQIFDLTECMGPNLGLAQWVD